ncbi:MAG: hypothetical protein JWN44_6203 [Myxococcales bacterium]|nr:hypothetical protein [Myxococcales bacterium]
MRGASALDHWLDEHRDVAAFVVWEPVLAADDAPPASQLARHAHNYWDPTRARSQALETSGFDPACLSQGSAREEIVWDALFDFAPQRAAPAFCGRPIVDVLGRLVERR